MKMLQRDTLPKTGFAGVRERRLVTDGRLFGGDNPGEGGWDGIGNLVYLADARFKPRGETLMHEHRDIDVISVMIEGRIAHEGSLEHGKLLSVNDVQVQRAGAEGFSHNEVNPDDTENRMIQLWVLPESKEGPAEYRRYQLKKGGVTRVYGGDSGQGNTFSANTVIDIALLEGGQSMDIEVPFVAYLSSGAGFADEDNVSEGCLMRGEHLTFDATQDAMLIIAHTKP